MGFCPIACYFSASRCTTKFGIHFAASPVPVGLCGLLPLLDGHWGGRGEHGRRGGHDGGGRLDCDDLGLGLGHELRGLGYEWGWLSDELRLLE